MVEPEGGLRDRLVHESLAELLRDSMDQLGWFNEVDPAVRLPVQVTTRSYSKDEEIPPNTIVVMFGDTDHEDIELGSLLSEDVREFWIEIYAQDEAVLNHLRGDVVAILRGKHPGCGRVWNTMDLIDWTLATPASVGVMHLNNVRADRARVFNRPWQEFLVGIRVEVVEER